MPVSNPERSLQRYGVLVVLLCLMEVSIIVGLNVIAGPNGVLIASGAVAQTDSPHFRRTELAASLRRTKPVTLILGNSRVARYRSDWAVWERPPVFVSSIGGMRFWEMQQVFDYAVAQDSVERVYLFLDAGAVTRQESYQGDHTITPYNPETTLLARLVGTRFSPEATAVSLQTVRAWLGGQSSTTNPLPDMQSAFRSRFHHSTKLYSRYIAESYDESTARALQDIAERCRQRNIELTIVFNPLHAWAMEMRYLGDQWGYEERVRRETVALLAANAQRWNATPYPIWDFASYEWPNTESVPPTGSSELMQWFSDPWHYSSTYAEHIAQFLETGDGDSGLRASFLTSATVDAWADNLRRQRDQWTALFPEDAAFVRSSMERNASD